MGEDLERKPCELREASQLTATLEAARRARTNALGNGALVHFSPGKQDHHLDEYSCQRGVLFPLPRSRSDVLVPWEQEGEMEWLSNVNCISWCRCRGSLLHFRVYT
ncbi:uncharacterized protein [Physcomitrium patens]|uniref:uncharacterized protein n=1 Tax=Physcomitrium patens TaxID=3218 RepID=UPI003CCDCE33